MDSVPNSTSVRQLSYIRDDWIEVSDIDSVISVYSRESIQYSGTST